MSDEVHFALKKTALTDFNGASTTIGDGNVVNVGARLEEGDGVISTEDGREIAAFQEMDILKQVSDKSVDEAKQEYASRDEEDTEEPPTPPTGSASPPTSTPPSAPQRGPVAGASGTGERK